MAYARAISVTLPKIWNSNSIKIVISTMIIVIQVALHKSFLTINIVILIVVVHTYYVETI